MLRGLAALLAVLVGLVLLLQTGPGQDFVRARVERAVGEQLHGSFALRRLHFALFGPLTLGGVTIRDTTGKQVASLDKLKIVPAWGALLRGQLVLQRVALSGLRLNVKEYADGTTNLTRLLKKRPRKPSQPKTPSQARYVAVRELTVQDVDASVQQPGGDVLSVKHLGLDASLSGIPQEKTLDLDVSHFGADVGRVDGPVVVRLTKLETGLGVHLKHGAGKVELKPTKAHVALERDGAPRFERDIALDGVSVDLAPGELGAVLHKLALGVLVLQSLEVRGQAEGTKLTGEEHAALVGLKLDHARANQLLGREVLTSDMALDGKISGPPKRLALSFGLETGGGSASLSGTADVRHLDAPAYDLQLGVRKLATARLLSPKLEGVPPVELDRLDLGLRGEGIHKEDAAFDLHLDLGPLRVRGISIDRVVADVHFEKGKLTIKSLLVEGLGQKLRARGSFHLADKQLSLDVEPSGDVGRALAKLRAAGVPLRGTLPPGGVTVKPGELSLHVEGRVDRELDVSLNRGKLHVAGGVVAVDVRASLEKGAGGTKLGLTHIDGAVDLRGLRLAGLGSLAGKHVRGVDGTLGGHIKLSGTKENPRAKYNLTLSTGPRGALRTVIRGTASEHRADVSIVARESDGGAQVAHVEASVPLTRRGGKPALGNGKLHVLVDVPERRLSELTHILPDALAVKLLSVPDGKVSAHADIHGTTADPEGSFDANMVTQAVPGVDGHQRINLHGTLGSGRLSSTLSAWLDDGKPPIATAKADVELPKPGHKPHWNVHLAVRPPPLEDLPPLVRQPGLAGTVELDADLSGTRHDVGGTVTLDADGVRKGRLGPLHLHTVATLAPADSHVDSTLSAGGVPVLAAKGTVGIRGRGLLDAARAKKLGDPPLDVVVDVRDNKLSSLTALSPKLEHAPGRLGGRITVTGTAKLPLVDGALSVDHYRTVSGAAGHAALALSATHDNIDAALGLGAPDPHHAPVALTVHAARPELEKLLRDKHGAAEVALSARAHDVPLSTLVPRSVVEGEPVGFDGELDWNMDGHFRLEAKDGHQRLQHGELDGRLALRHGVVTLPGTTRRYHDVELELDSNADHLTLKQLSLHESDLQVADRRLSLSGRVDWNNFVPKNVTLELDSKDWLLFGTKLLGKPDAPRATLSAKIVAHGNVTGKLARVDTTVESLDMNMPERFDKAHWPEETDLGDVSYLGDPGAKLGKLKPTPGYKPKVFELPPRPGAHPKPLHAVLEPLPASGTVIYVHIPKPIHVHKPPFNMMASGSLRVVRRPGADKPEVRGELDLSKGAMTLGGRLHVLDPHQHSRIVFNKKYPKGAVDFHLVYAPNPVMLRDVSKASAGGDVVRMRLVGPISEPEATVRGVANADLWDMLPVYNAGRVKWKSAPGLPASETVQIPRKYDVILLSYMALNLPHNLFLDRISAWADPYDGPDAYGKIRHLEAERYSKSGKVRVRATERPATPGRSTSELELDYMLVNHPRVKAGAGVAAGDRLGGGPALFFEWDSEN